MKRGQAVFLLVASIALFAGVFCALSGAAVMTDANGRLVVGRPADFAQATALTHSADLARQSTQIAVYHEATAQAAALSATGTAIAQVLQATQTAAPYQAAVAQSGAQTAVVNAWGGALARIGGLVVALLVGLGLAAWVNKRATSVYPNAAGLYPVITRKTAGGLIVHDPNRQVSGVTLYDTPGLARAVAERAGLAMGATATCPLTASEAAHVHTATQALATQLMSAITRGRGRAIEDSVKLAQAASGATAASAPAPLPNVRVIDDPQKILDFENMLELEVGEW